MDELSDEDRLTERCADLVSCKRFEPALARLFQTKPAGEWVTVAELDGMAGGPAVTWLTSPNAQPGYAVIFFCDDELQWSMTAYYNVARLFETTADGFAGSGFKSGSTNPSFAASENSRSGE
jgi:hypothetical protein